MVLSSLALALVSLEAPKVGPLLQPVAFLEGSDKVPVGQRIKLIAGVKNVGDADAWLDGRLVGKAHLRFKIIDSKGQQVEYPGWRTKVRVFPPLREDFVKLRPGYSLTRPEKYEQLILAEPGNYKVVVEASHGASGIYAKEFGIKLSPIEGQVVIPVEAVK